MRFGWIVAALLGAAPLVFMAQTRLIQNPRVVRTLMSDPQGELAGRVLILDLPSGKSIPINYLVDPSLDPLDSRDPLPEAARGGRASGASPAAASPRTERVYGASDFFWWRELRDTGAPVAIWLRGERRTGHAQVIEDDPERRNRIFDRLRPTAPRWFGRLIEIRLDSR